MRKIAPDHATDNTKGRDWNSRAYILSGSLIILCDEDI